MLAAPVAPREPAVPALVAVVLAQVPVLAQVLPHPPLRVLGQQVLADVALEEVAVQLLNRQSC